MDVSWRLVKVDNCLYFEPLAPKASYPLLRQAISLSAFFFQYLTHACLKNTGGASLERD